MADDLEGGGASGQELGGVVAPNPARGKRVVVSVSLARGDFDRIAGAARARGLRVSEFIKRSSIEAAPAVGTSAQAVGFTYSLGEVVFEPSSAHRVFGRTHYGSEPEVIRQPPPAAATIA